MASRYLISSVLRVLSSRGGRGEASPPKFSASRPKLFAIINCLILKCVILSKILVECYMKTAKNGQCACMCQHFSPKLKFLDRTLVPIPLFPCALNLNTCSLATANTTSISTHQCHHKHTIPMSTCKLSVFFLIVYSSY